jgi:hypothetical protein
MVDATNFKVVAVDDATRRRLFNYLGTLDDKVHRTTLGKIAFIPLTEGTIAIVNTGAATDKLLTVDDSSLLSFVRNALFSATYDTDKQDRLVLVGFVISVDHTVTSPNTDVGHTKFELSFRYRKGTVPTVPVKSHAIVQYLLESKEISEAAAIETVKYAGPFKLLLAKPDVLVKSDDSTSYLGAQTELWRNTTEFAAHTAVTTYTLKVYAHAVVVDEALFKKLGSPGRVFKFLEGDFEGPEAQ